MEDEQFIGDEEIVPITSNERLPEQLGLDPSHMQVMKVNLRISEISNFFIEFSL
jgi:hypothetical protein